MDEPTGSYNICELCDWEDDPVQLAHPRLRGGANRESLVEAQAVALDRFPIEVEMAEGLRRDRTWRPLREDEQLSPTEPPRSSVEYFHASLEGAVSYYWKK
jgi:hypothetical protein